MGVGMERCFYCGSEENLMEEVIGQQLICFCGDCYSKAQNERRAYEEQIQEEAERDNYDRYR